MKYSLGAFLAAVVAVAIVNVMTPACANGQASRAGGVSGVAAQAAATAKLYITNQSGASISIIDQNTFAVDTVIDLTKLGFTPNAKPHHVAVEKDGSFWYATLIGDGKVLKFNRANKLMAQVSMETPGLLSIDPVHDSLYVGRSMTAVNPPKSLGVIRRSTFTLVDEQEIQIPRPHALAVSRDGKWVHAASLSENRIASVEIATGRVTLTTLPGDNARSLVQFAITPDGRRMVVGGELSNSILVFDLTRPPPFAPIAEIPARGKPWDPVISADGSRAYISLFADTAIAEVNIASGRIERTISGALSQPYSMVLRADGRYMFVVNQNMGPPKPGQSGHENMPGMSGGGAASRGFLSVINMSTGKIERTIPLGAGPTGMGAAGAR